MEKRKVIQMTNAPENLLLIPLHVKLFWKTDCGNGLIWTKKNSTRQDFIKISKIQNSGKRLSFAVLEGEIIRIWRSFFCWVEDSFRGIKKSSGEVPYQEEKSFKQPDVVKDWQSPSWWTAKYGKESL